MSKFTTQIRWIVEQEESQYKEPPPAGQKYHDSTYRKLGLSEYPIFNEEYRATLNDKIIWHYYFREIGFETVAMFQWYMQSTMWEIMPYYNKLYESEIWAEDIEPLKSYDKKYHEDYWGTTGTTADGTANNKDRNVFQDTPMSMLDEDEPSAVANLRYATNVTYDDGETTSHNVTSGDNKGGTDRHDYGFTESQSDLLLKYRKTFLNIDVQVIGELKELFMGLW